VIGNQIFRVFNFVILCYLQSSQKLDAGKKLVFYSICCRKVSVCLSVTIQYCIKTA